MDLHEAAWFWGLCGALIYSGGRLSVSLWGEKVVIGRGVFKAWSDFAIGVISGPIFAEAFGPVVFSHIPGLGHDMRACALTIGLSVNSVQPIARAVLESWIKTVIGAGPK